MSFQEALGLDPAKVQGAMEANLKQIARQKRILVKAVPGKVNPLKVLLMMPQHVNLQRRSAQNYFNRIRRQILYRWIDSTLAMRHVALQRAVVEKRAAMRLQCLARSKIALARVHSIREIKKYHQDRAESAAATTMQCLYRTKTAAVNVGEVRRVKWEKENYDCAVLLQKHFRRYLVRGDVINRERMKLLHFLREWGHGTMASLTMRSNLQSRERGPVVAMSVKLTQAKDRPIRLLPKLQSVQAYLEACMDIQTKCKEEAKDLHSDYVLAAAERELMGAAERESYNRERRDALVEHDAEVRAEVQRAIEKRAQEYETKMRLIALKKLNAKKANAAALAEIDAREAMSRADRRSLKLELAWRHERYVIAGLDRVVMLQEDAIATASELAERAAKIKAVAIAEAELKIKLLQDREASVYGQVMKRSKSSWLDREEARKARARSLAPATVEAMPSMTSSASSLNVGLVPPCEELGGGLGLGKGQGEEDGVASDIPVPFTRLSESPVCAAVVPKFSGFAGGGFADVSKALLEKSKVEAAEAVAAAEAAEVAAAVEKIRLEKEQLEREAAEAAAAVAAAEAAAEAAAAEQARLEKEAAEKDEAETEAAAAAAAATAVAAAAAEAEGAVGSIFQPMRFATTIPVFATTDVGMEMESRFRTDRESLPTTSVLVTAWFALNAEGLERVCTLQKLRTLQGQRTDLHRWLCAVQTDFARVHGSVCKTRQVLRTAKGTMTRGARKNILEELEEREAYLCGLEAASGSLIDGLVETQNLEMAVFSRLFSEEMSFGVDVQVSRLECPWAPSPVDTAAVQADGTASATSYQDALLLVPVLKPFRARVKLEPEKPSPFVLSGDFSMGGTGTIPAFDLDEVSVETEHPGGNMGGRGGGAVLSTITSMRSTADDDISIVSIATDAAVPPVFGYDLVPPRRTGPATVPGLTHYTGNDLTAFAFYVDVSKVLGWSTHVAGAHHGFCQKWRARHRPTCISFVQRLCWVGRAEETEAALDDQDTTFARKVDAAPVLDLYELVNCRRDLALTVLEPSSESQWRLRFTSNDLDVFFALHPASLAGRGAVQQGLASCLGGGGPTEPIETQQPVRLFGTPSTISVENEDDLNAELRRPKSRSSRSRPGSGKQGSARSPSPSQSPSNARGAGTGMGTPTGAVSNRRTPTSRRKSPMTTPDAGAAAAGGGGARTPSTGRQSRGAAGTPPSSAGGGRPSSAKSTDSDGSIQQFRDRPLSGVRAVRPAATIAAAVRSKALPLVNSVVLAHVASTRTGLYRDSLPGLECSRNSENGGDRRLERACARESADISDIVQLILNQIFVSRTGSVSRPTSRATSRATSRPTSAAASRPTSATPPQQQPVGLAGFELVLDLEQLQPCKFLTLDRHNWTYVVPQWMKPVYVSGVAAAQPSVAQRVSHEHHAGRTDGPAARLARLEKTADRSIRAVLVTLRVRALRRTLRTAELIAARMTELRCVDAEIEKLQDIHARGRKNVFVALFNSSGLGPKKLVARLNGLYVRRQELRELEHAKGIDTERFLLDVSDLGKVGKGEEAIRTEVESRFCTLRQRKEWTTGITIPVVPAAHELKVVLRRFGARAIEGMLACGGLSTCPSVTRLTCSVMDAPRGALVVDLLPQDLTSVRLGHQDRFPCAMLPTVFANYSWVERSIHLSHAGLQLFRQRRSALQSHLSTHPTLEAYRSQCVARVFSVRYSPHAVITLIGFCKICAAKKLVRAKKQSRVGAGHKGAHKWGKR